MSARAPRVVLQDADTPHRELLHAVLRTVLLHPVAAQAGYTALIAEGRRFAESPEGADWLGRIRGSTLTEQLRLVWESASLGALQEGDVVLPDALVETFVAIAARGDLESFLASWLLGADPGTNR